jgi:hypothetical protein
MQDRLKREMIWQRRTNRRLLLRRRRSAAVRCFCSRLPFGVAFLDIADQEFELFDIAVELFRRASEARAPQNGELHFQLLDQQRFGVNFRGERRREAPQFGGVFRQISSGARHAFVYHKTRGGALEDMRNL